MIYTIGHGALTADAFASLLKTHDVATLADVRSHPGSRHSPHFGRDAMSSWLPADHGIGYRWLPDLGGRRRSFGPSRHMALEHPSFRSYADWMESNLFLAGIEDLLTLNRTDGPVAYCCCESVYWRCHRRMISDYLMLALGIEVRHIMHDGSTAAHKPTRGVRLGNGELIYDVGAPGVLPLVFADDR